MRTVKLIKFEIEEVPCYDECTIRYSVNSMKNVQCLGADSYVDVQQKIVPVTRICNTGKEDIYVAYTQETEDLLGIPVRTILGDAERFRSQVNAWIEKEQEVRDSRDEFRDELYKFKNKRFFERFKFLIFGNKIK